MSDGDRFQKFLKVFENHEGFSPKNIQNVARDTSEIVALKITNQFRISLEASIQKIDEVFASSEKDWDSIQKVCHKLAGSSELVGFTDMGRDCRTVMNTSIADAQFQMQVRNVRAECVKLLEELKQACPELSTYV